MAVLKNGKSENLTIRVEPDFKKRVEDIRQKYFNRIPMNIFLEMMVEVGIEVEEQFAVYKKEIIAGEIKKRRDLLSSGQEKIKDRNNGQ